MFISVVGRITNYCKRALQSKTKEWPTLAHTADLHGTVPLSVLTGQIVIIPTDNEALITEELNYSAVGKHSTRGWVAGVASILRF